MLFSKRSHQQTYSSMSVYVHISGRKAGGGVICQEDRPREAKRDGNCLLPPR